MNKETFLTFVADTKIKLERGQTWFYFIKNALLIAAALKVLLDLAMPWALVLTILTMICFYAVGWVDLKKIGILQRENLLMSREYNPVIRNIEQGIKNKIKVVRS